MAPQGLMRTPRSLPRASPKPLAALLLVLLLAAPLAEAHIAGARPILQRSQLQRLIDLQPQGADLEVDLLLSSDQLRDPLRHLVSHEISPSRGRFYVEYTRDASVRQDLFFAEWRFARLIEYRDLNFNGLYEPTTDTPVRAWRFDQFDWGAPDIQRVQVADVQGWGATWIGNLSNAPRMSLLVAFAGKPFRDEGALVLAQDVAIYFDVTNIPTRGIGSLYALEIDVRVPARATLSLHEAENTTAALLADAELRRGLFVWGGEALLDGREQRLLASLTDESVQGENRTAKLFLHLPTVDQSMRFVMVSGVEYVVQPARSGTPLPPTLALAALALAVALTTTRARRR